MGSRYVAAPDAEEWMTQAACRPEVYRGDPEVFYPPRRRQGAPSPGEEARRDALIAEAKRICDGCPVTAACLEFADRMNETEGIWGGLTPQERGRKELR